MSCFALAQHPGNHLSMACSDASLPLSMTWGQGGFQ